MAHETRVADVSPDDPGELLPFVYDITSYGADYPVDGVVRRLQEGDIAVPPFQRSFVWKKLQADRFIESLLLGLPVPGIFLAVEDETRRMLVVDGQQRLTTLLRYYTGQWDEKVFRLEKVQERFRGLAYQDLSHEDRRRLNDSILHATVIRQDQPSDDDSSIYFVFERLNTAAVALTPQEIRNSIFQGPFRDLLEELAHYPPWLAVFGAPSTRLKDRELILRFLALLYDNGEYSQPMKRFLNRFMGRNRDLKALSGEQFAKDFTTGIDLVAEVIGRRAFRLGTALNAAVFDAVMVGVTHRLWNGPVEDRESFAAAYERLLETGDFEASVRKATANEENVSRRLVLAVEAFADLK